MQTTRRTAKTSIQSRIWAVRPPTIEQAEIWLIWPTFTNKNWKDLFQPPWVTCYLILCALWSVWGFIQQIMSTFRKSSWNIGFFFWKPISKHVALKTGGLFNMLKTPKKKSGVWHFFADLQGKTCDKNFSPHAGRGRNDLKASKKLDKTWKKTSS